MNKAYRALTKPYVVTDGRRFRLKNHNPKGPGLQPALPPTGTAMTPTPFEPAEHVFARLDTARRGFLTRDQVSSLERFPFDAADVNADGMLTIDEFARAWGPYNSKK